jgi:hypothetical protein
VVVTEETVVNEEAEEAVIVKCEMTTASAEKWGPTPMM